MMTTQLTVAVSTTAQLLAALKVASAGETIQLQAGSYSGVAISGIDIPGGVTITSQSSASPATLMGLNVTNSSGITFSNLDLSGAQSTNAYPFRVGNSSYISFTGVDVSATMSTNGFYINGSSNVSISSSNFHTLATAITELNNTYINISNNSFSNIQTDGIDNGGSSYVTIANNSFTNFEPSTSSAHPDAIQFWTANTTSSAHDISITGNQISVGSGGQIQGIFIKDDVGNLPFENVTVSGNTVTGELWNAISIDHATGLSVQNNTVVAASAAEVASLQATSSNSPSSGVATTSWIAVEDSSSVALGGNNSPSYELTGNTSLVQNTPNEINGVAQYAVQYSSTSATLGPLSTALVLIGNAAISGTANAAGSTVIANNAGDRLYDGVGGSNTLIGGAGNDVLISRTGSDTLTGGGGNNTFQIGAGVGADVITDFGNPGSHNTLNLSAFISAGLHPVLTDVGQNTVVSFAGSQATITLLGVQADQLTATATGFTH